jgi:hypothetical protein
MFIFSGIAAVYRRLKQIPARWEASAERRAARKTSPMQKASRFDKLSGARTHLYLQNRKPLDSMCAAKTRRQ